MKSKHLAPHLKSIHTFTYTRWCDMKWWKGYTVLLVGGVWGWYSNNFYIYVCVCACVRVWSMFCLFLYRLFRFDFNLHKYFIRHFILVMVNGDLIFILLFVFTFQLFGVNGWVVGGYVCVSASQTTYPRQAFVYKTRKRCLEDKRRRRPASISNFNFIWKLDLVFLFRYCCCCCSCTFSLFIWNYNFWYIFFCK